MKFLFVGVKSNSNMYLYPKLSNHLKTTRLVNKFLSGTSKRHQDPHSQCPALTHKTASYYVDREAWLSSNLEAGFDFYLIEFYIEMLMKSDLLF